MAFGSAHSEQVQDGTFHKLETIGTGAYGSVHIAKYGDTLCAAKILHQVLFHYTPDGQSPMLERFEEECQLLRTIRHPCIVQFLDKLMDPTTGLPVLLMELMDQSLTAYLDKCAQPPPYHWQVNIMHDVATALSYLHSRRYIHRDLSSNNVLLVTGAHQAKLSDFGVSRTFLKGQTNEMTACPGSIAYSAPESQFVTSYSEKIDVFSLGVVGIQIATCKFPQPGPQHEQVSSLPSSMLRVIPEVLRRQNHIRLIPNEHCLKELLLNCLQNDPMGRPSSSVLCDSLQCRKQEPAYIESVRCSGEDSRQQMPFMAHRIHELTIANERLQEEVDRLQQEARTFSAERDAHQKSVSALQNEVERLRRSQVSQVQVSSSGSRSLFGGLFRGRELEQLQQQLQQALQERNQYLQERDTAIQERHEIFADCEEARKKATSLQDELEWSITRLEEREQLHSQAVGKYDDLQMEYFRKCRLLNQANTRVERQATKLSELGDRLDREEQESERLQECIESRDGMIENIQLEQKHQQATRQSSAADQQSLQGIMEYIKTTSNEQIERLRKQLSDKEKELKASQTNVIRLENEIRIYREQHTSSNGIDTEIVLGKDLQCSKCSHSTYKDKALTVNKCSHILCKSCLVEILIESKDDPICPVSSRDSICSNLILQSDIDFLFDPKELEAVHNRGESDPVNETSNAMLSQQGPEDNCEGEEQTDYFKSDSKPSGKYNLLPVESMPEPVVKSKLPPVERSSLIQTQDDDSTNCGTMNPINQSSLAPALSAMSQYDSDGHVDIPVTTESFYTNKSPNPQLTKAHSLEASPNTKTSTQYTKSSSSLPPLFSTSYEVANSPPTAHTPLGAHTGPSAHFTSTPPASAAYSLTAQPPPADVPPTLQPTVPPVDVPPTVRPTVLQTVSLPPQRHPPFVPPQSVHVPPPQAHVPPPPQAHIPPQHIPPPAHFTHGTPVPAHETYGMPPHPNDPNYGYSHNYSRQHSLPHSSPSAHRPPQSYASYPPESSRYKPRTAPIYPHYPGMFAHGYPHDLPPTPEYEYPYYESEHSSLHLSSMGSIPPYSISSHRPRPFTSPHAPIHYHHNYHPHAYTEGSIHSGHEFRNDPSHYYYNRSENSYNPQTFSFSPFQSDTASLVSSLRSSGGEDEYLAVLMQQKHILSHENKWKVVFTVCPRTPCCVEPLQELLNQKFGEQFEVTSFCIKFNDAVTLRIPLKEIETQGYSVHTTVEPCKIARNEVIPPGARGKVTPTYPPRHTLTITPLPGRQTTGLMVALDLAGIETCDNQRHFCLKSPPLLPTKPQSQLVPTSPPGHGRTQPDAHNRLRHFEVAGRDRQMAPTKSNKEPILEVLLQGEADTNSVCTTLGHELIRNEKVIEFGQALGVDYYRLKEIFRQAQAQSLSNPSYRALCDTVEHWRKCHDTLPTWDDVVNALRKAREPNLVVLVERHLREIYYKHLT